MDKTGIAILDQALQQISWMKLPAYRRFWLRYGKRKARILRDYVIFPFFGIKKISQLKGKVPYRIQEVYEVVRLLFRFPQLVRDVSRLVLKHAVAYYYSLNAEDRARVKFTIILVKDFVGIDMSRVGMFQFKSAVFLAIEAFVLNFPS